MKSSIIDVPRKHTQEDLFGIQVYQDALIKYIRLTDTPITIALQGEWGSGKTSLMNLLKEAFFFKKNMDTVFMDYDEYLALFDKRGNVEFFGRRPDIPTVQLADKKIVISTNWPTTVNGKPANFAKLLDILRQKLKYRIEAC